MTRPSRLLASIAWASLLGLAAFAASRPTASGRGAPSAPPSAVSEASIEAASRLRAAGGATDVEAVAADLAAIGPGEGSGATLAALLDIRSPLYAGRDKGEAGRLRGFVVATSHRLGASRLAWPAILDLLANSDSPYEFAAAARAAGGLGPAAAPAAPLLARALDPDYRDDVFSLDRYSPTHPDAEATTAANEAVVTLGRIGPVAAGELGPLARFLQHREAKRFRPGGPGDRLNRRAIAAAREARESIGRGASP